MSRTLMLSALSAIVMKKYHSVDEMAAQFFFKSP